MYLILWMKKIILHEQIDIWFNHVAWLKHGLEHGTISSG